MNEQETIADIIAEMRKYKEVDPNLMWDNSQVEEHDLHYANRLEAAHRRELSKNVSKNGADFGQLGDAAKLREALNRLVIASEGFLKTHSAKYYVDTTEALDKAKAALAAPPRNCDRFATLDEARKAHEEYRGDYIMRASNKFDFPMEFEAWLVAPATEKEGANDGNE